jgi:hypothetical protein
MITETKQTWRRCAKMLNSVHSLYYFAPEADAELAEYGVTDPMAGYLAGRAAPLGEVGPAVVTAAFNAFSYRLVAEHLPAVWATVPPAQALAARTRAADAVLRRLFPAEVLTSPELAEAAELALRATEGCAMPGRPMYAANAEIAVPGTPHLALWHAATLLREHRGDGHNAALVAHGIGGTEAHVLLALSLGMRAEEFGRIHHLPRARLAAVIDGLRGRGLVDAAGGFTDAGRETRERIEALTDELAAPAYDVLRADELDELVAGLEPIAAAAKAVDD